MSKKIVCTLDMPRDEWLKYRRGGIGGSNAATVVGLNPHSSLFTLYYDKLGMLPEKEDNEAMRQGRDFEEYVSKRWEEATGKKCRRTNYIYAHDDYDYIRANVDRVVVGENAGLECKTTSVYNKSDFENGNIPPYYYVQCVHYMAVKEYDRMYLAVLVLSGGFYEFVIEREENEINSLVSAEVDFWNQHILAKTPPKADGSESADRTLRALFPAERAEDSTTLLMHLEDEITKYQELSEKMKMLDCEREKIKQLLITELGDNTAGESEQYRITFKPQIRTSIDSKALKADMPEAFAKYTISTQIRVLRFSKKTKKENAAE